MNSKTWSTQLHSRQYPLWDVVSCFCPFDKPMWSVLPVLMKVIVICGLTKAPLASYSRSILINKLYGDLWEVHIWCPGSGVQPKEWTHYLHITDRADLIQQQWISLWAWKLTNSGSPFRERFYFPILILWVRGFYWLHLSVCNPSTHEFIIDGLLVKILIALWKWKCNTIVVIPDLLENRLLYCWAVS